MHGLSAAGRTVGASRQQRTEFCGLCATGEAGACDHNEAGMARQVRRGASQDRCAAQTREPFVRKRPQDAI
jgi:hypothetical protein